MEFFKKKTQIDFMALQRWAAVFSAVLILLSFTSLLVKGLNWGLEFTGGTELRLQYQQQIDPTAVREALLAAHFHHPEVQMYGSRQEVLVRLAGVQQLSKRDLITQVQQILPKVTIESVNYIGPQVGAELATNGVLALFIALIGTALYIALRFEWRFAVSAAIALLHDPIIILGIFSFFGLAFNLIALAAILTIMGYSLNDTIVIFDRVRENFRRYAKLSPPEIINLSVNETLSRTIITSGATLLAVLALLFFGGPTLQGFSVALCVGIIVGTYSSIYVAGSLAVALGLKRADFLKKPTVVDERP